MSVPFIPNWNMRALRKVDEASYPWRNAKTRGNRRRLSYWSRVMWYQAGLAIGMTKKQAREVTEEEARYHKL
jgi:hypothetical protein